ncbi:hypothetical protein L6R50_04675 [Myxococcota bacterium]|nr:hypothetical protein [Myxococcota bacterium]
MSKTDKGRVAVAVSLALAMGVTGQGAIGAPEEEPERGGRKELEVALQPASGSETRGRAVLVAEGRDTRVTAWLAGPVALGARGYVNRGSCAEIGEIVAPLPTITEQPDGSLSGSAVVAMPLQELVEGDYVIAFRPVQKEGAMEIPISCGEIR